jgi:hypothetical protein
LLPPIVLIAVVGLAVVGRLGPESRPVAPSAPIAAAEVAVAGSSGAASVRPAVRSVPAGHRREEGTDGLMGRLPFGLPNDTPFVRIVPTNRFVIDDVLVAWSGYDSTPPWVRRLGGLSSYVTDPYMR